tara:strand:+ start:34 stop:402 length:369 start_codon:yes stop_codon:yes gene_type:complete
VINIKNFYLILEFRVIGLNIKPSPPPKVNESEAKSLGVSKKFLENEFKDSLKKINRNVTLQIQDLLNIYGRYGWEHYYQGQIGNQITLYFRRDMKQKQPEINIKLSPEEKAILQCLDKEQMP